MAISTSPKWDSPSGVAKIRRHFIVLSPLCFRGYYEGASRVGKGSFLTDSAETCRPVDVRFAPKHPVPGSAKATASRGVKNCWAGKVARQVRSFLVSTQTHKRRN